MTREPRRAWSASDDALLRTMIEDGSPAATTAAMLNRTEKAVYGRGNLLGLKVTSKGKVPLADPSRTSTSAIRGKGGASQ